MTRLGPNPITDAYHEQEGAHGPYMYILSLTFKPQFIILDTYIYNMEPRAILPRRVRELNALQHGELRTLIKAHPLARPLTFTQLPHVGHASRPRRGQPEPTV